MFGAPFGSGGKTRSSLHPFSDNLTPKSSSPPAPVAGQEACEAGPAAAGCASFPIPSASLPIPSARGCELAVGGTCRAAGSRSGAGSLDCIPQTLFPSRALIPGLGPPRAALRANDYFPLIDYPCHCGADILAGSPAWSLIMGA